jgi:8-oxo-dGTP diphosphatase
MNVQPQPRPLVSADVVVFTVRDKQLAVRLARRTDDGAGGLWALPGGVVGIDEDLEQRARHELEAQIGVRDGYLEQLYTFGRPGRHPAERVISVAYCALVPAEQLPLGAQSQAGAWFTLDAMPPLAWDHAEIIAAAHQRLVAKLHYSTIAFQLMPRQFTLRELQEVYEIILQEELDKRNFRKRVLALDGIEETHRERRDGRHRPAKLYRARHPEKVEIIRR